MMKKTAVSARARLLPAIAALCVTGVVSAHAENAPATTPAATAAQGAQPAATPATPPAAQAKVDVHEPIEEAGGAVTSQMP